jgi:hypothetical protein
VLDWRKRQQTRAAASVAAVEEVLEELPPTYTDEMYLRKSDAVYQHVCRSYYGSGRSIYARAS